VTPGLSLSQDFDLSSTVAFVAVQPSNTNENDKGGQGEDFGKSSPVGLVLLILFFIAVFFLVKSMNKHLKRVPASFDEPADAPSEDAGKAVETPAEASAEPKNND
jgi:Na+-transporting methylmalonyl-CoA/oxaloacetate decarboxylase gamma subunit